MSLREWLLLPFRVLVSAIPFLLVMSPTIVMIFWGRHHLPEWWYRLPSLPWVTRGDKQLAAIVAVFFATLLISLPIRGMVEDFMARRRGEHLSQPWWKREI